MIPRSRWINSSGITFKNDLLFTVVKSFNCKLLRTTQIIVVINTAAGDLEHEKKNFVKSTFFFLLGSLFFSLQLLLVYNFIFVSSILLVSSFYYPNSHFGRRLLVFYNFIFSSQLSKRALMKATNSNYGQVCHS